MRRSDIPVILILSALIVFFLIPETRGLYEQFYSSFPLILTFIKFALLATAGEILALRIRQGQYSVKGFGILPKMLIWGLLGLAIYAAFGIFSAGVPILFEPLLSSLNGNGIVGLVRAFLISFFMNLIFAPVMMLTHHITDAHIAGQQGRFRFKHFKLLPLLEQIDWPRIWGVIFKRTIPLFWIPAHTVTFLLPEEFRTLFAAALSVALGLFLGAFGGRKGRTNPA